MANDAMTKKERRQQRTLDLKKLTRNYAFIITKHAVHTTLQVSIEMACNINALKNLFQIKNIGGKINMGTFLKNKKYCPKCDDWYYNPNDIICIEVKGMCHLCFKYPQKNYPEFYEDKLDDIVDKTEQKEKIKAIKDSESQSLEDFHKAHLNKLQDEK